jgi:hypothetical protein
MNTHAGCCLTVPRQSNRGVQQGMEFFPIITFVVWRRACGMCCSITFKYPKIFLHLDSGVHPRERPRCFPFLRIMCSIEMKPEVHAPAYAALFQINNFSFWWRRKSVFEMSSGSVTPSTRKLSILVSMHVVLDASFFFFSSSSSFFSSHCLPRTSMKSSPSKKKKNIEKSRFLCLTFPFVFSTSIFYVRQAFKTNGSGASFGWKRL